MRYLREADLNRARVNLDAVGSIHASGSVIGMQNKFNWPKGGQVRVGQYIYNIGVAEVQRLKASGLIHGG